MLKRKQEELKNAVRLSETSGEVSGSLSPVNSIVRKRLRDTGHEIFITDSKCLSAEIPCGKIPLLSQGGISSLLTKWVISPKFLTIGIFTAINRGNKICRASSTTLKTLFSQP